MPVLGFSQRRRLFAQAAGCGSQPLTAEFSEAVRRRKVEPFSVNSANSAESLRSGILTSLAEPMLSDAIAQTLRASPADRIQLFTVLVRAIESVMAAHPEERPWTCTVYRATDGSTVFRGGVGHSLVIDLAGRLWRARSYEDFETTYAFNGRTYEIDTLTPIYSQMREYCSR